MNGNAVMKGELIARRIKAQKAPLSWRLRNALRWSYLWGWLTYWMSLGFSRLTGITTISSSLAVRVCHDGIWVDYGIVSRRVVTTAFVNYLVADWNGGTNIIDNFNYHGCGTGAAAEAVGDTALGAESTTILNPASTRATGTKSVPVANQARTVGTLTFSGAGSITEHGVFTQAATGGGTLQDRSVFTAIGVDVGDSIQFTYTMTYTAGG